MQESEPFEHSLLVSTALTGSDLGYAALYSPAGEFAIYAIPATYLLAALAGWLAYRSGASKNTSLTIIGEVFVVAWWVKWLFSLALLIYTTFQTWKLAGGWPGSNATHHFFTADGIEITAPDRTSLFGWADISRAMETKKGFFFYQGKRLATFIPKRCLEGPAEIEIIKKFIARNIADATVLPS